MNIPRDKQLHIIMGAVVALAAWGMVELANAFGIPMAMFASAAAVGLAYEGQQYYRKEGTADPVDAIYTAGGGLAVALLTAALML